MSQLQKSRKERPRRSVVLHFHEKWPVFDSGGTRVGASTGLLQSALIISTFIGLLVLTGAGCSTTRQNPAEPGALPAVARPEEARANAAVLSAGAAAELNRCWGVNVESLRLSAHGHLLDLRYRVINPEKAATLGDPKTKAFMIHEASGVRLKVPNMPKVGALRSTATRLTPGTIYVMLFANSGQLVKANDLVTLEIGAGRIEHLKVQ